jgi:hypothetical protein
MVAYREETSESESTEDKWDDFTLVPLAAVGGDANAWKIDLDVEDQPLTFEIDTGTEVIAISESAWKTTKLTYPGKNN